MPIVCLLFAPIESGRDSGMGVPPRYYAGSMTYVFEACAEYFFAGTDFRGADGCERSPKRLIT